jgi:hypothetical protein
LSFLRFAYAKRRGGELGVVRIKPMCAPNGAIAGTEEARQKDEEPSVSMLCQGEPTTSSRAYSIKSMIDTVIASLYRNLSVSRHDS